jgi:hypothetical protein
VLREGEPAVQGSRGTKVQSEEKEGTRDGLMRKDMTKKGTSKDIEKANRDEIEVLEPMQNMSPFISFHYSYKEISSIHGRTHIRSKEKRFANGKLESEEFEGILGGHVYNNMVSDMQRHFFNQMEALLKPFSMFLPFGSKDRKDIPK